MPATIARIASPMPTPMPSTASRLAPATITHRDTTIVIRLPAPIRSARTPFRTITPTPTNEDAATISPALRAEVANSSSR